MLDRHRKERGNGEVTYIGTGLSVFTVYFFASQWAILYGA